MLHESYLERWHQHLQADRDRPGSRAASPNKSGQELSRWDRDTDQCVSRLIPHAIRIAKDPIGAINSYFEKKQTIYSRQKKNLDRMDRVKTFILWF